MLRVIWFLLFSFLVPIIINALFTQIKLGHYLKEDGWKWKQWQLIIAAGIVIFMILIFNAFGHDGGDPSKGYKPAEFKDGKLIQPEFGE